MSVTIISTEEKIENPKFPWVGKIKDQYNSYNDSLYILFVDRIVDRISDSSNLKGIVIETTCKDWKKGQFFDDWEEKQFDKISCTLEFN